MAERPGYPYRDGDRYVRDPYEERSLRGLSRANDPYLPNQYSDRIIEAMRRDDQPEIRAPRYTTGQADNAMRSRTVFLQATPPRPMGWRVGTFDQTPGELPPPAREPHERLPYIPLRRARDSVGHSSPVGSHPYRGSPIPGFAHAIAVETYNDKRGQSSRDTHVEHDNIRLNAYANRGFRNYRRAGNFQDFMTQLNQDGPIDNGRINRERDNTGGDNRRSFGEYRNRVGRLPNFNDFMAHVNQDGPNYNGRSNRERDNTGGENRRSFDESRTRVGQLHDAQNRGSTYTQRRRYFDSLRR